MWSRYTSKLYVRIWLAVVATVMVLTFAATGIWHATREQREPPIREIVVRNKAGEVIGTAQTKPGRKPWEMEFDVVTKDGLTLNLMMPRLPRLTGAAPVGRPLRGFGFGWMLALVGLAVALGSYPIIRRLTLRLEALQRGVELWGTGDLSTRLNTEGNDEVAFLAERFNRAAQRIETLVNSHKSLLANASHELRSPLARIRMSLELMAPTLVASRTALPPEGANFPRGASSGNSASPSLGLGFIDEIKRSITELDELIDEILLASRLDTKQADAEPFEQLDLTGLAAEECARSQAELGVSATGQSLVMQGSPRLLRRLMRNLLENAKRYGQGEVTLELYKKHVSGREFAVIAVHDRGPGVPEAERERVFEPFYRLPGASERDGGVGLGLALVKSISERHGGTVRCEPRPGGGETFVVELQMSPISVI
jgi:signal transduction histidine kinase